MQQTTEPSTVSTIGNSQSGLFYVDEKLEIHNNYTEFQNKFYDSLYIESIIETNTNSLIIDKDQGLLIISGKKYSLTLHSASVLCKILKIPFTFTKKISLILLDINVNELKSIDKAIELIVIPSDNKELYSGIITNIIVGDNFYVENYHTELFGLFEDKVKEGKIEFLQGYTSRAGFHLYYLNKNSKKITVNNNEYVFGQCILGDIYKIDKYIHHYTFAYNISNGNIIYFSGEHPQAIRYIILSKKAFAENYQENLYNNMAEDIGIYKESTLFETYINYADTHNISYMMLESGIKHVKKLMDGNTEFAFGLFGIMEKEQILAIREKADEIKNSVSRFDVTKAMCTKGVKDLNCNVIVNNILHSKEHMITLDDMDKLNSVCYNLLFETYECKVQD